MDISKLPRMSNTPANPEPANVPAHEVQPQPHVDYHIPPNPMPMGTGGIEAWLSFVVGAFLLFMYPRWLQWASSRIFHTHFDEFMLNDKVVPYQQVPEFWMDLGPVLFGIVLILDGVVLLAGRLRKLLIGAFMLTLIGTAYNVVYVFASFSTYGFAPVSFLAAAFGGYIVWYQWNLIKALAPKERLQNPRLKSTITLIVPHEVEVSWQLLRQVVRDWAGSFCGVG